MCSSVQIAPGIILYAGGSLGLGRYACGMLVAPLTRCALICACCVDKLYRFRYWLTRGSLKVRSKFAIRWKFVPGTVVIR